MPICKYFQQGTCIYGNRCKFDHEYTSNRSYGGGFTEKESKHRIKNKYGGTNDDSRDSYNSGGGRNSSKSGGTSILRAKAQASSSSSLFGETIFNISSNVSGSFSSGIAESKPDPVGLQREVQKILQEVKNEFTLWAYSGQWPLSCYSIYEGKDSLPGFIDYSCEELRYFIYESSRMGNLKECMEIVKGIYDKAKLAREQLVTPSPEVLEILTRLTRRKIEKTLAPSDCDQPAPTISSFGSASGGNEQSAPPVASLSFSSHEEPSASNKQNFPAIETPHGGLLENAFPNNIFSNKTTYNHNFSIFGETGHLTEGAQILNVPSSGNRLLSVTSNNSLNSDLGEYSQQNQINNKKTEDDYEEVAEEMKEKNPE